MSLKTSVKVGMVNNLSDARYCAGMGVEIIGFSFEADTIETQILKTKEIIGWLSGVQVAAEIDQKIFLEKNIFNKLIDEVRPDYIQLPFPLYKQYIQNASIAAIVAVNTPEELIVPQVRKEDILLYNGNIASNVALLKQEALQKRLMLECGGLNVEDALRYLDFINPYGIALKGGHEVSPGLKDFTQLADFLEALEVEN